MDIIVCIKQVPDTNEVKIDPKKGTLIREGVPSIINHDDKHALEEAVCLKEEIGGKVTTISMGPPQAADALREAYALGADEVILLSDKAFAGADTWATSYALGMAIKKIGKFDLIFCGKQAIDGDTAQVGPGIAEWLNISQVTFAVKIELTGTTIKVERLLEELNEVVIAPLPCLLTVVKQINEPRVPSLKGMMKAKKAEIKTLSAADIGADIQKTGLNGSPTRVVKIFTPPQKGSGEIISGETTEEIVSNVVAKLQERKLV